jgi:hypothetical protein
MNTKRADWLVPSGLIALSLVPALAGTVRLAQLAAGATITPDNARFFAAPLPVAIHIPTVVVFNSPPASAARIARGIAPPVVF